MERASCKSAKLSSSMIEHTSTRNFYQDLVKVPGEAKFSGCFAITHTCQCIIAKHLDFKSNLIASSSG